MGKPKRRTAELVECPAGHIAYPVKLLDGTVVPCLECLSSTRPTGRFSDRTLFAETAADGRTQITRAPDPLAFDLSEGENKRRRKIYGNRS